MTAKRKLGIFIEIASAFPKPRNDGISAMTEFLNDRILDGILNEIPQMGWGMT
ncbi:MAG: hypothetical protein MSA79_03285 [Campylobacter sp.]|nr:hypothetical protein [Campylobacter sp.]